MAIINEHWRNASESVEVISFPDGNLTVFIKNSEAIIFESLFDFFQYRLGICEVGDFGDEMFNRSDKAPILHIPCYSQCF